MKRPRRDTRRDAQAMVVGHPAGKDLVTDTEASAQDRIAAGLRALYATVLDQPLPDHLERLVQELGSGSGVTHER
ncbi:MAG TPA: NepR family anti-sigma factor [Microvirga sp.]|jgi:hypothetical protein|nr:NepR family anti-sigma factor [Microvirga sp.]